MNLETIDLSKIKNKTEMDKIALGTKVTLDKKGEIKGYFGGIVEGGFPCSHIDKEQILLITNFETYKAGEDCFGDPYREGFCSSNKTYSLNAFLKRGKIVECGSGVSQGPCKFEKNWEGLLLKQIKHKREYFLEAQK